MGFVGRGEGVAALAVATLARVAEPTQAKAALRHELRERRAARTDEGERPRARLVAHAGTIAAPARTVPAFVGRRRAADAAAARRAGGRRVRVLLPVLLEDADLDSAGYPAPLAPARSGCSSPPGRGSGRTPCPRRSWCLSRRWPSTAQGAGSARRRP